MRVLVVDGYNVIRRAPAYVGLAERDLESARAALVSDVAAYASGEWDATVVFDGGGNPSSTGTPERVAGVSVVFSPHGTDADSLVESISRKSRDRGDEVFVVSSDAHVQWAVMGRNVARVSADEFGRDLAEESEEMFEHTPSGSIKSRLEDRIDPEIRAALARMLHP